MESAASTRVEEPRFAARSELVTEAYGLAADAHDGQRRKDDGTPYITHPVAVAELLHDAGFDDEVIAAALLHDVVEDTEMGRDEIAERFGDHVAELVDVLSEDEDIEDYEDRKREHREQVEESGRDAIAIYVADKLSNLRDMRRIYAEEGESIASRFKSPLDVRVGLWREDLETAKRSGSELQYLGDFERELEHFERERAARRADGGQPAAPQRE